jgi:hypothetical protein
MPSDESRVGEGAWLSTETIWRNNFAVKRSRVFIRSEIMHDKLAVLRKRVKTNPLECAKSGDSRVYDTMTIPSCQMHGANHHEVTSP